MPAAQHGHTHLQLLTARRHAQHCVAAHIQHCVSHLSAQGVGLVPPSVHDALGLDARPLQRYKAPGRRGTSAFEPKQVGALCMRNMT